MTKLKMNNAFKNYGKEKCKRALELYEEGNGANTIGYELDLTTRQADSAINAYRYYKA